MLKQKKEILFLFSIITITILIIILLTEIISAQICDVEEVKNTLRKALFDYLPSPKLSKLNASEIKDLLIFYLNSSNLTSAKCDIKATLSNVSYDVIVKEFLNLTINIIIPYCNDGTHYGKCSTTKPRYCFAGQLVNRCRLCGCPVGEECKIDEKAEFTIHEGRWGKCVPLTENITCRNDSDCPRGFISYFCQNNNIYGYYPNYTCINPGTVNSYCKNISTISLLVNKCNITKNEYCFWGFSTCQLACSDKTRYNQCSSTKPLYCKNGSLISNCTFCGCPSGQVCNYTTGSCYIPKCSDGTLYGNCSTTKPLYCQNGTLINNCTLCGCLANYTCNKNTCQSCVTPVDGMNIINNTIFCSGIYNLIKGISISADNITLDCNDATLNNPAGYQYGNRGISLNGRSNVTIKHCNINNYDIGIHLESSRNNLIINNYITNSLFEGINIVWSGSNKISSNTIRKVTYWGIAIDQSSSNSIYNNTITNAYHIGILSCNSNEDKIFDNEVYGNNNIGIAVGWGCFEGGNEFVYQNNIYSNKIGIYLTKQKNKIYHNNFIDNSVQAQDLIGNNSWDNGTNGGNYWSDYNGTDKSKDGIGDVPYVISSISQDRYPFMSKNGWLFTPLPFRICYDSTLYGSCSTTKPLYCSNGTLINNCSSCGCSEIKVCQTDGSCIVPTCSNLRGYICASEAYCPGNKLNASDTDRCCSKECVTPTWNSCRDCGTGLFNICDRTECNSITENCYFISNLIGGSCSACAGAICNNYSTDQSTCSENHCNLGNCSWIDGSCVTCVDKDKDGYNTTAACGGTTNVDCNDNNVSIYPSAKEICGNGVDEDCNGIDLICTCPDGTRYNNCSTTKPLYCSNGTLINKCSVCGCPANQSCQANGSCMLITEENVTCTDSDGVNYGIKGTCIDYKGVHVDACDGPTATGEYHCTSSYGYCQGTGISCTYAYNNNNYVCEDGACVEASGEPTCIDTDGRNNWFTKGTCTDSKGVRVDKCDSSTSTLDYYCTSPYGICSYTGHSCTNPYGSDYICYDGACVNKTTTNTSCVNTCSSLGYKCGFICDFSVNCGSCSEEYKCQNGACIPPTLKLVLNISFECNAKDNSGYGNDGTIYGANFVTGKVGNALSFDGIDDYISVGTGTSLNISQAITIEAWIKPSGIQAGYARILFKGDGDYPGVWSYGLAYDPTGNYIRLLTYTTNAVTSISPAINTTTQWYHVVGTYNGSIQRLYINGIEVDSDSQSGNLRNAGKLGIGAELEPTLERYFNGSIDEVKIYLYALTSQEIQTHYQSELNQIGKFTCVKNCSDGTSYSTCSLTKPFYCSNGILINKCSVCGCPTNQTCLANESCITPQIISNLSDGSTEKNITFNGTTQNQTIYVEVPSGANITNATIDVTSNLTNTSLSLDVGNDGDTDWSLNETNQTHTTPDLSSEINEYITNNNNQSQQVSNITGQAIYTDSGNILVPFTFYSDSIGVVKVSNIAVSYVSQSASLDSGELSLFEKIWNFIKHLFS